MTHPRALQYIFLPLHTSSAKCNVGVSGILFPNLSALSVRLQGYVKSDTLPSLFSMSDVLDIIIFLSIPQEEEEDGKTASPTTSFIGSTTSLVAENT